jgi:hypothetical protein
MAAEPVRKPDIRELVGIAVNTSALKLKEGQEAARSSRGARRGDAGRAPRRGRDDVPIAGCRHVVYGEELDARDVMAGELGPMLWHIRYGGQHGLVPKAIRRRH